MQISKKLFFIPRFYKYLIDMGPDLKIFSYLPALSMLIALILTGLFSPLPTLAQENGLFMLPPAPTLISPNINTRTSYPKPFITGLSMSSTTVYIYIDGIYNGNTGILTDISGTADFAYRPFLNLGMGRHKVWAVSKDAAGRKSRISNIIEFNIEAYFPAPTLMQPASGTAPAYNKPSIVGLAKNDSVIKVYVDRIFFGKFNVKNHPSGTANFAYPLFLPLTYGKHLVYTEAVDQRGKTSPWSNTVHFTVKRPLKPSITPLAAIEEADMGNQAPIKISVKENIIPDENQIKGQLGGPAATEEKYYKETLPSVATTTASSSIDKISEIFNNFQKDNIEEEDNAVGYLNERKEKQGKIKLNIIIFIVFLGAVIGWIIWINRELIRERRDENIDKHL